MLTYDELDNAIALNNEVPQSLSSAIFALDIREAEWFMAARFGMRHRQHQHRHVRAEVGGAFGGEKQTGGGPLRGEGSRE